MAHKTCAIAGKKLQRDHGAAKAVPHPSDARLMHRAL